MKQRNAIGLALAAAGAMLLLGRAAARSARGPSADWPHEDWAAAAGDPVSSREIARVPLLVVQGARSVVTVAGADVDTITLASTGRRGPDVHVRRSDDGHKAVISVPPRHSVDVRVPHGTELYLKVAGSRAMLSGLDNVRIQGAKARLTLRDVAGDVRVDAASSRIDVDLAHNRETRSLDVHAAKATIAVALPASFGGTYDVQAVRSRVSIPSDVEDGIPIRVRAAASEITISAA